MKNKLFILLALVGFVFASCQEEGADLRPGLYVDTDLIDAFAFSVF